ELRRSAAVQGAFGASIYKANFKETTRRTMWPGIAIPCVADAAALGTMIVAFCEGKVSLPIFRIAHQDGEGGVVNPALESKVHTKLHRPVAGVHVAAVQEVFGASE